jgi:hypothetical protein
MIALGSTVKIPDLLLIRQTHALQDEIVEGDSGNIGHDAPWRRGGGSHDEDDQGGDSNLAIPATIMGTEADAHWVIALTYDGAMPKEGDAVRVICEAGLNSAFLIPRPFFTVRGAGSSGLPVENWEVKPWPPLLSVVCSSLPMRSPKAKNKR